jgi:hypothetical protein
LRDSILRHCVTIGDNWALEVQGRLEECCDLVHPEAVYHVYCYVRFSQGTDLNASGSSGRPENQMVVDTFENLCDWLEITCEDKLYTVSELMQHMEEYSKIKYNCSIENIYSSRHLKHKVRYGDNMCFAEFEGRKKVVCFSNLCAWIVNDKWYTDKLQDVNDENERIVKAAAKLIAS